MKRTKLELRPAKPLPSLTIGADWPSLADPRRGGPQYAFWPFDWGMSDKTAYRIMAQRQGRQGLRQGLASTYGYVLYIQYWKAILLVKPTYRTVTVGEVSFASWYPIGNAKKLGTPQYLVVIVLTGSYSGTALSLELQHVD